MKESLLNIQTSNAVCFLKVLFSFVSCQCLYMQTEVFLFSLWFCIKNAAIGVRIFVEPCLMSPSLLYWLTFKMKDRIPLIYTVSQAHMLFDLCDTEAPCATHRAAWKQHAQQKGSLLKGGKMNRPKSNPLHFPCIFHVMK